MSNLITDRVAYFLKDYPPFNALSDSDLDQVANKITVKYFEEGSIIFEEGEEDNPFCYILNQGNIKLLKQDSKGSQFLVDQCEPGDIFGVRSIITQKPYSMTAKCIEESLVYAIPKEYFEKLFSTNPSFATYFASGYAAGQAIVREDQSIDISIQQKTLTQSLDYSKEVITCTEKESIRDVARRMSEHSVGSIVITDQHEHPIGIVTDTDLRNKVLAQDRAITDSVSSVMSSPVKTVQSSVTLSEVLMEMIRSGVHHLVMTVDGTPNSMISGIVSDHDVVLSQQNHPASLIKSIKRSKDVSEWKRVRDKAEQLLEDYLEQELSMSLISSLITKINDTIIEKAIDLALEKFPKASGINFCWLSLGSEGREEQLLRTDQDNAILFEDSDNIEVNQSILLEVAKEVNGILMECGFEKCPADIMAQNPKYCQPLSEWKKYFSNWIKKPDPKAVMNSTIFFDFRVGYGNEKLAEELGKHLTQCIQENEMYLKFLAQNSLQNPPPLSFFKNFLVERSGEHKDEFDIKKRGMMPLSDAARLLILDHHIYNIQNTSDRFRKLAELEPRNNEIFDAAADSYELFMRHRALNGLKDQDSGRFISLEGLNKLEKQMLKNAFLSIKEVQDMIKVRFQQAYFN